MSFLRTSTAFSSLTRRAALSSRNLSTAQSRFAQGYGDGNGDPKGENPQAQGSSNHEKHTREHPGPDPPSAGKDTGAGPTKAGSKAPEEEASAQSGGSRSKDANESGSSPTGGSIGGGKEGASPKIHDRKVPGGNSSEKQAEVDKHNREFEQRHDRAAEAQEDKVDKKFWNGQGGRDDSS